MAWTPMTTQGYIPGNHWQREVGLFLLLFESWLSVLAASTCRREESSVESVDNSGCCSLKLTET